jgi:hypothetical protein
MNWKKITLNIVIAIPLLIVVLLIYDAIAVMNGGSEASISSLLITSAYKMPIMVSLISWFIGLVQGHLFWRLRQNEDTKSVGGI